MQTIIGLALIVGTASALLRLLAWLGQGWERGYLFEPRAVSDQRHLSTHGTHEEHLEFMQETALGRAWPEPADDRFPLLFRPVLGFHGPTDEKSLHVDATAIDEEWRVQRENLEFMQEPTSSRAWPESDGDRF